MKTLPHLLKPLLLLLLTETVTAGGIPLTTDDLDIITAINSNQATLDVLSNDDSGILNDPFKAVVAVCDISSSDMDCVGTSFSDGIGTVTVNGTGSDNNVLFDAEHHQSHQFKFKYKMQNSANNPGFAVATVDLAFLEVNTLTDTANNSCDATMCSLRTAIAFAVNDNEPTVIKFKRDMNGTIALNNSLVINSIDLSIIGPGADKITLSGQDLYRVLSVPIGTERFYLAGLTLSNGQTPNQENGAGILIESALETRLENIRVTENNAEDNGGGIYALNAGLTLINSEISYNSAVNNGGGIGITGGFGSDVTIINTTISHNQAGTVSGGLYINSNFGQNTTLKFITAAFNAAGVIDNQITGNGNVTIESSVFEPGLAITASNNFTNNSIFQNISGTIVGNNNLTDTTFILSPALTEINQSGLHGHKFEPNSLAYNHVDNNVGNPSCGNQITTDQFATPRPLDGACDAGAYEYLLIDLIFATGFE